jgi:hypothetical protein
VILSRDEALAALRARVPGQRSSRRAPREGRRPSCSCSAAGATRGTILFELRSSATRAEVPDVEYDGRPTSRLARASSPGTLGIEHVAVPRRRALGRSERRKNDLTNFCADEHTWVLPAADYLAPRRTTIYDGIGGDVLSAGLFLSPKRLRLYAEGRFLELARDISVGSVIPPMFRRDLRERLAAACRSRGSRARSRAWPASPIR